MKRAITFNGDCLEGLKSLRDNSVDSVVTDPPAGISFMGKAWDDDKGGRKQWVAWMTEVMRECLRVLKPGAHGLVWALPRTSHWTATALEDAGFEVRDVVTHLFGSGFPKSLDVSKAIDKAAGAQGEIIEQRKAGVVNGMSKSRVAQGARPTVTVSDGAIRAPSTDAAKKWQGFGTALKPASEHWILVRKPCSEKTVAANVLKWGTGALNIDASRIDPSSSARGNKNPSGRGGGMYGHGEFTGEWSATQGRFPANLVLSHTPYCSNLICDLECAIMMLDQQSGHLSGPGNKRTRGKHSESSSKFGMGGGEPTVIHDRGGTASRFFYCAKISKSERNAGLEGMEARDHGLYDGGIDSNGARKLGRKPEEATVAAANNHPTVKPQKLMGYLIRMVTPPGGIVLDPFMGSGSTGCAAIGERFGFIGMEREAEYHEIAQKRIQHAERAS